MFSTLIIGKRSFLSKNLKKGISNSKLISINEIIKNKSLKSFFRKKEKINIIYNHAFPLSKLNQTDNYCEIIHQNINKLNEFLLFLTKKKIKINKFIFSSSSAVYGIKIKELQNLQYDYQNRKIYALTKLLSERLLLSYSYKKNFNLIIARIFNIYGDGDRTSLISKIIHKKIKNQKIIIKKKNNASRDFISVEDVVKLYLHILNKKSISGTFDIGSGKSTKVNFLINKYFEKNKIILKKESKLNEIIF